MLRTELELRAGTLFAAIAHGDDDHRAWLKEAIDAHFAGQPVPAPRGSGNKEARIAALLIRIEGLTEAREALTAELSETRQRCMALQEQIALGGSQ